MNDYKNSIGAVIDIINGFSSGTLKMYSDLTISVNNNEALFQIMQGNNTFSSFDRKQRFIRTMTPIHVIESLDIPGRTYKLKVMMSPNNMNTYSYNQIIQYTVPLSDNKMNSPPPLPGYDYIPLNSVPFTSNNTGLSSGNKQKCKYGQSCRMLGRVNNGRGSSKDIKHTQIWH